MDTDRSDSLDNAFYLLNTAFTQAEVEAARAVYQRHLERWPDDWKTDIAHCFPYHVGALREREAESRRLGLSPEHHAEREGLLQSVREDTRGINAFEDSEAAVKLLRGEERLNAWIRRHPRDRHALYTRDSLVWEIGFAYLAFDLLRDGDDAPGIVPQWERIEQGRRDREALRKVATGLGDDFL